MSAVSVGNQNRKRKNALHDDNHLNYCGTIKWKTARLLNIQTASINNFAYIVRMAPARVFHPFEHAAPSLD